jgi:DNA polymerase-1
MTYQPTLFDSVQSNKEVIKFELPNLKGQKKLFFDTEGTGLRMFSGDHAIGISVATVWGHSWYIPWGHAQGFNFDKDKVELWIKDNFRDKELVAINTKFDIHNLWNAGIDLESLNVTVRDVAYHAALTNSKRQSYALADLAIEHSKKRKLELLGNLPIHLRYSEDVHSYACMDALLLSDIEMSLGRRIESENLIKVRDLEDSLIFAVCSMERNGARIDHSKLEQWGAICTQRMTRIFWSLAQQTGFKVEPTKSKSVAKLCFKLGLTPPVLEARKGYDRGADSITNDWLQLQHHPLLQLVFEYRKLSDLKSDYLDKYLLCLDSNNIIRYNLNQLKSDGFGTVTGRFSSSGSKNKEDDKKINVQQVVKVDGDEVEDSIISDMPIRELFVPEEGRRWLSADASQLQFRIFAHYSNDDRLIDEYVSNPKADFHTLVAEKILGGRLKRSQAKHENFGNLFGMGVEKGARRLSVTVEEYKEIKAIYNKRFPAAKKLSYQAQELASHPNNGPNRFTGKIGRGYVRTLSGRRRRYDVGENLNSAVNAVIQGTEADIVKIKLRELYNARKTYDINLYFTVHDEFDGGIPMESSEQTKNEINEMLNDHSSFEKEFGIKMKVPILWDIKVGDSWNL